MKTICVYCGSSPGSREDYSRAAEALAEALVDRGLGLVYGGASVGVMGHVADSVLRRGGRVIGVIPEALVKKEIAHQGLSELRVTASMHERKTTMANLSDGFIALPGGIGTLEEIFEIWTWAQLGFHQKPCGLLNVSGYYDALNAFLDHAVAERFVRPVHRDVLMCDNEATALLDRFADYTPPVTKKWIEPGDT